MNWDRWPNFTEAEFRCKGNGECRMDEDFLDRLQYLRNRFGRPMPVTSGYRSPEYNAKVSTTGTAGPHTTGKAADIRVSGKDAYDLIKLAIEAGFRGIGISQKGAHASRFIHLDMVDAGRPTVWSY